MVVFILLSLLLFSYAYHVALATAVIGFVLLGLLLTNGSNKQVIDLKFDSRFDISFELNSQGVCSFDGIEYYQLQANSRFSFLGCWLTLQPLITQPIPAANAMFHVKNTSKKIRYFIYRDSLSEQDFSRLSNVIAQLEHQH